LRDDAALDALMNQVSGGSPTISLEQWIRYNTELATDKDTPEQIKASFKTLADSRTDPLSSPAVGQCMKVDTSRHLRVRLAAHLPLRDVMASPANGIRCSTSVVHGEARVMHCGDLGGVVTYTRWPPAPRLVCIEPNPGPALHEDTVFYSDGLSWMCGECINTLPANECEWMNTQDHPTCAIHSDICWSDELADEESDVESSSVASSSDDESPPAAAASSTAAVADPALLSPIDFANPFTGCNSYKDLCHPEKCKIKYLEDTDAAKCEDGGLYAWWFSFHRGAGHNLFKQAEEIRAASKAWRAAHKDRKENRLYFINFEQVVKGVVAEDGHRIIYFGCTRNFRQRYGTGGGSSGNTALHGFLRNYAATHSNEFSFGYKVLVKCEEGDCYRYEERLGVYAGLDAKWAMLPFAGGEKLVLNQVQCGQVGGDGWVAWHRAKGHYIWSEWVKEHKDIFTALVKWYMVYRWYILL
jgi:hypothetical protein